ncbi:hypothetical protein BDM02DRAFT_3194202 [Thelephora ganbajun]|uniref:Uncharacterized protein n=1 Tax=Thelephora ganbajun TaxID=370292 RepID=A0ACB6YWX1_THEGA|nr:hypothetical protein BDM02DRAFT_3194202 [Thelephora ganbajun]
MFDQDREFRNPGKSTFRNDYFQRRVQGQYRPKEETQYVPMDVDAIKHRKDQQEKKKTKPPIKQSTRLPPHPTSSSRPIKPPFKKRPLYCFICDQPRHFARECKAKINKIKITHIQQLGLVLEESMYTESQEDDQVEDEDYDKWMPDEDNDDSNDHQKDLITFNPDDEITEPDF